MFSDILILQNTFMYKSDKNIYIVLSDFTIS